MALPVLFTDQLLIKNSLGLVKAGGNADLIMGND